MVFIPPGYRQALVSSAAVYELSQKLGGVIQEYQRSHPDVSSREIRQALEVTAASVGRDRSQRLILMVAAASVAGLLALMFGRQGAGGPPSGAFIMPMAMILLVIGVVVALFLARR